MILIKIKVIALLLSLSLLLALSACNSGSSSSVSNDTGSSAVTIDVSFDRDSLMEDCPVGTLTYFSPWGNVVMYYGFGGRYNGLYNLGYAISGSELIKNL